jgi:metal-responsive CopG/Arc/MetJ family transcriptional regulator
MAMKRLDLRIPDELLRRFKIACTLQGCNMSEAARQCLEEYVEKIEQRKLIVVPKENTG